MPFKGLLYLAGNKYKQFWQQLKKMLTKNAKGNYAFLCHMLCILKF